MPLLDMKRAQPLQNHRADMRHDLIFVEFAVTLR
jgi:hypothetical protein